MSAAWRYRSRRSELDPEPDIGSSSRGSNHRRSRHDNGGRRRRRREDRDPHGRSSSHRALRVYRIVFFRPTMLGTREREPVILGRIVPGLSELVSRDVSRMNIPRINLEALQREVFRNSEEGTGFTSGLLECCICLEKFQEGDELIRLNCAHRFHTACLEPWVVTSGNCPYCRASIYP